jgi:hypothetical protein
MSFLRTEHPLDNSLPPRPKLSLPRRSLILLRRRRAYDVGHLLNTPVNRKMCFVTNMITFDVKYASQICNVASIASPSIYSDTSTC